MTADFGGSIIKSGKEGRAEFEKVRYAKFENVASECLWSI